jgi:two-component system sensor kinase FixL
MVVVSTSDGLDLEAQKTQGLQIAALFEELHSLRNELRIVNKEYRELYNFNSSALLTIDRNLYIYQVNFQAALLLGVERKFLFTQLLSNYMSTSSKLILEKNIRSLLQARIKQTFELVLLKKNAGLRYVNAECVLAEKNNLIHICLTDASKLYSLMNRNVELEKSSKLLNQLIFNSHDATASLDHLFNFQIVTEPFTEAFTRIIASKITSGCNLMTILADVPQVQSKIINAINKASIEKKEILILESAIRKNEVYFCYRLSIQRTYNEDNTNGFVLRVTNITDVKLQERIEQQSEIAISSRISAIGELATAFAHEINQPLTAINTYSRACLLLVKNKSSSTDHSLLTPLEKIVVQSELAAKIIHNMKNFRQEKAVLFEKSDINTLINDAIGLLHYELQGFNLKINLNLMEDLPQIKMNRIHIMQVVLNLARNSIEALQESKEKNPELTIATEQVGQQICLHVCDNGPGIPAEFKNKILKDYFTTKSKGTGIGLGICRTFVEAHGGNLTIQEQGKKGAAFTFTLPIGS